MAALFLPRGRGFEFPAGAAPGIDFTHPAATGCSCSAIATGGNVYDMFSSQRGTLVGTPIPGIDGTIGPYTQYALTTRRSQLTGKPATVDTAVVQAVIFVLTSAGANQFIFTSGDASGGWAIRENAGTIIMQANNVGGNTFGGIDTLVANVPYFFVQTQRTQVQGGFAVLVNLATGKTTFGTCTGSNPIAGSGTYAVGANSAGQSSLSNIAAAMHGTHAITNDQALAWAADPWSFWYPQYPQFIVGTTAPVITGTPFRMLVGAGV